MAKKARGWSSVEYRKKNTSKKTTPDKKSTEKKTTPKKAPTKKKTNTKQTTLNETEKKGKLTGVAGHSLGEFSALVASNSISFEDGLKLVRVRANEMKKACEMNPGTMAAVMGLENKILENCCIKIKEILVPANYNCPGQIVVSGEKKAIKNVSKILSENGARKVIELNVGGAFHSPLMKSAQDELEKAINNTYFFNVKWLWISTYLVGPKI